jgi:anti-anti-sigma factor
MRIYRRDKTLYIVPMCDLIASQVEELRDAILDKFKKENSISHVILNAEGIDVVDSLGVNLIIGTYRQSDSQSMSFEVINASMRFTKISAFFKFEDFFKVSPEKKTK